MVCTFFGHREILEDIEEKLYDAVEKLITECGVDSFYIGNQGSFDSCAKKVVKKLSEKYPQIRYSIVLAYMPTNTRRDEYFDFSDTIVPDASARSHPRYAIAARNKWMLERADFVVAYVKRDIGGAARFVSEAKKKGKKVINIA